jgi:hypothetical protein
VSMLPGGARFAFWVALSCVVPLAALGAVLMFGAPVLPTSLVAFVILALIAPRLLGISSRTGPEPPDAR